MKSSARIVLIGILASLLLSSCGGGTSAGSSQSFVAGNGSVTFKSADARKAAPSLSGKTLDGGSFTMTPGRVTVVTVWASWCAPCRAEAPALASLSESFPDVSFVGILTRDNQSTANAFVRRFALPYPSLVDDSVLLGFRGSLSANAIPTTVLIDKKGRVAARISGEITISTLRDLIIKVSAE
jgi:thiol-disulfide isomerase/thioredoxin